MDVTKVPWQETAEAMLRCAEQIISVSSATSSGTLHRRAGSCHLDYRRASFDDAVNEVLVQ